MLSKALKERSAAVISAEKHAATLAVFRIAFGLVMLISTLRFIARGWIYEFYILPHYFFTFPGFEWIKPFGAAGMYLVFGLMAVACLFIMLGLFYRLSVLTFFLSFTYVELIDKTNYLNHYYFVSIITFLLLLVPAQRYFSLDVARKPSIKVNRVPAWTINIFRLQLCIVYFFSGLAKINYDWLIAAQPLRIWLPANSNLPLIGPMLSWEWVAVFFSWFGMVYDLTIWYFLLKPKTRNIAYFFVVLFHVFTAWFFKIGMFPYIMILLTLIFFPDSFHEKIIGGLRNIFSKKTRDNTPVAWQPPVFQKKLIFGVLAVYFVVQLILPFRYLAYPGKLFWTEEGYRFSWRVMLMEKGGTAFFHVKDPQTGREDEVVNSQYLTPLQEKMMATQPDMILQFAHYLHSIYQKKGISDPVVTVESYVTLNSSGSRLYIDSSVDLSKQQQTFAHDKWILPFQNPNQR
jgi:hypothetical protein